jgi:ATP-dependent Lhr-like helicase
MDRGRLEEANEKVMRALRIERGNRNAQILKMEIDRRLATRGRGKVSERSHHAEEPPTARPFRSFRWRDYADPLRREEVLASASSGMDLIIEGQAFSSEDAPSLEEVMRLMPISYEAFYSDFPDLREVQKLAARPVLQGSDVFISASTSSGKTEAAMAPLMQMAVREGWRRPSIAYIAPTKALANNIALRLERPMRGLGRRAALYTGDRHDFNPGDPTDVVVTVPETIDSLMRLDRDYPFLDLRAIVIDELHLMDGNYRGDQLRVLLKRMQKIAENRGGRRPQMVGLSATVADPSSMWARYAAADRAHIVHVGGRKGMRCRFLGGQQDIVDDLKARSLGKGIIFCNTRAEVEKATQEYQRRFGGVQVRAHHGSLSKETRGPAEEWLLQTREGFMVATMTLEIGIDVGDLDVVVIDACPWTAASLAQRIGRACRRKQEIEVVLRCTSEEEGVAAVKMLAAVVASDFEAEAYEFDISVAAQQIISICTSRSRIGTTSEDVASVLGDFCAREDIAAIMDELVRAGLLRAEGGRYLPPLPEKVRDVNIFSNVPDGNDVEVVDQSTGSSIGRVGMPFDETFMLAGQCWKVVGGADGHILAERTSVREYEPRFGKQRVRGAFFEYLPAHIKARYPEECDRPGGAPR